jgi:hypothetical protein
MSKPHEIQIGAVRLTLREGEFEGVKPFVGSTHAKQSGEPRERHAYISIVFPDPSEALGMMTKNKFGNITSLSLYVKGERQAEGIANALMFAANVLAIGDTDEKEEEPVSLIPID